MTFLGPPGDLERVIKYTIQQDLISELFLTAPLLDRDPSMLESRANEELAALECLHEDPSEKCALTLL